MMRRSISQREYVFRMCGRWRRSVPARWFIFSYMRSGVNLRVMCVGYMHGSADLWYLRFDCARAAKFKGVIIISSLRLPNSKVWYYWYKRVLYHMYGVVAPSHISTERKRKFTRVVTWFSNARQNPCDTHPKSFSLYHAMYKIKWRRIFLESKNQKRKSKTVIEKVHRASTTCSHGLKFRSIKLIHRPRDRCLRRLHRNSARAESLYRCTCEAVGMRPWGLYSCCI